MPIADDGTLQPRMDERECGDDAGVPADIRFNALEFLDESACEPQQQPQQQRVSEIQSHTAVSLQVHNISFAVLTGSGGCGCRGRGKAQTRQKVLLDQISCQVHPGQVLAILGSSGAGKTTFLNLLAGRLPVSGQYATAGTLLLNGHKRNMREFRQLSAYVEQQDTLFSTLTVYETISFSALLRLPEAMPLQEKTSRVEEIIKELGLGKCRDTYIGDHFLKGISGGEKRRVCIGIELVTDPSLIFLDEPTTGLDSFNAQNVVFTLMKLAKANRTVICTIHQPRSQVYQMFDLLLLLSEGKQMYFGAASEAVGYFEQIGFRCPSGFNPADYLIDLISYNSRTQQQEKATRRRIEYISQKFKEHYSATQNESSSVSAGTAEAAVGAHDQPLSAAARDSAAALLAQTTALHPNVQQANPAFPTSWFTQLGHLTKRSFRNVLRNSRTNKIVFFVSVFFGILLGCVWLQEGDLTNSASVPALAGVLFFLLVNQSFSSITAIVYTFPTEKAVVSKERAVRSYHIGTYFFSKMVSSLPSQLCLSLVYSVTCYFMMDLRAGASHFFMFLLVSFLCRLNSEGLTYVIAVLAATAEQALTLSPIAIIVPMLFSGFLIATNSIPVWLRWLRWISYLKYAFSAIMQNEFQDRTFSLNCESTLSFCPSTGQQVLDFYGSDEIPLYANILGLLGLAFAFRLTAYLVLRFVRAVRFNNSI